MAMRKKSVQFWTFWILFNAVLFVAGWIKQQNDFGLRLLNRLQLSVFTSRGAGLVLAVDSALLIVPMCRNTKDWMRNTFLGKIIPFDESIFFHKVCAWTILLFSLVHTNAHYVNFFNVETRLAALGIRTWQIHYTVFGGWTGHIMLMLMFFMYTSAAIQMRHQSFETFWFVHHLAFIWYLCIFFHGYGCFVKTVEGECRPYYSWAYCLFVATIYLGERIYREIRGNRQTKITNVVLHPGNALEIQWDKPSMKYLPGQYVFINIPEIAGAQWHPFTLTSCPDERYISVHCRLVGDWTKAAARCLGQLDEKRDWSQVKLRVDGPYCAPADRVFEFDHAILVGAGIGVTPFASILKSMYFKYQRGEKMRLKKADFFWVNRDKKAFEWFQAELANIENMLPSHMLNFHLYLTEKLDLNQIHNYCVNVGNDYDPITDLRTKMSFGRPNWEQSFAKIRDQALGLRTNSKEKLQVAVFFCGPAAIARALDEACNSLNSNSVEFSFYKEHF
ncbi:ferric reductase NAD binding domain-domain-containing protein [Catenaria anguillulae PL171]|uniref:Ferric reductase NAD binding domain-domain-containing protein n=1 Tax=Catenaria anguillulae PL171 TaxID=765915 RepID=A0A1Y2I0D8_9FUNG|nr:ferric reductase NAD binding domain-domain-containing protein [Catenaria anguillulae PL171]